MQQLNQVGAFIAMAIIEELHSKRHDSMKELSPVANPMLTAPVGRRNHPSEQMIKPPGRFKA